MKLWSEVQNNIVTYWDKSILQFIFYACLLLLFFLEKDKVKKHALFWYPLLVYAALSNPLAIWVGKRVWGENVAYFARKYSLVPVFYVMAYAAVLVLKKLSGVKKLLAALAICGVFCFFGTYNYADEYQRSVNKYKIPTDVIVISDWFDTQGKDITIATPVELTHYFRQYNADLHIISRLRDGSSDIPKNLSVEFPDVEYVMSKSCMRGCDYVVTLNQPSVDLAYESAGYEPVFQTAAYSVYACGGYVGYTKEYNEKEQITAKSYYNKRGEAALVNAGYHRIEYGYDDRGNVITEAYFDKDDEPVACKNGYASVKYTCDKKGRNTEVYYFAKDGSPYRYKEGYSGEKLSYNEKGRVSRRIYTDAQGNPVTRTDGYSAEQYTYKGGRVDKTMYLDKDLKPVRCKDGYFGRKDTYDDDGNLTERVFLDENGKPAAPENETYAVIRREYNSRHYITKESYFDVYDSPTDCADGFASVTYERDASGNNLYEAYFDPQDEPVFCKDGYGGIKREYNSDNKEVKTTYVNVLGYPMMNPQGYSIQVSSYNAKGILRSVSYYDTKEKLVRNRRGVAKEVYTCDDRGNRIKVKYFNTNGKITFCRGKYAGFFRDFDENNRLVKIRYFDRHEEPCMTKNGYAVEERVYDENGKFKETVYYDLDGNKVEVN